MATTISLYTQTLYCCIILEGCFRRQLSLMRATHFVLGIAALQTFWPPPSFYFFYFCFIFFLCCFFVWRASISSSSLVVYRVRSVPMVFRSARVSAGTALKYDRDLSKYVQQLQQQCDFVLKSARCRAIISVGVCRTPLIIRGKRAWSISVATNC